MAPTDTGGLVAISENVNGGTFRDVLQQVLDLQGSYSSHNTSEMERRGLLVRQAGPARLRALLPESIDLDPADLETEGKDGIGRKTRVPQIRVFSSSRSPSAMRGWYVVYLFAFDGSAVYLSLNQGTTSPSGTTVKDRPDDFLRDRVAWARDILKSELSSLDSDDLALQDTRGLGPGYERGNVVARRYSSGSIPTDDVLQSDLKLFVDLLARLYSAEEDPDLAIGLPREEERESRVRPGVGTSPGLEDVATFIEWIRDLYGPELVPSRLEAEQEARDLLTAYAGSMTKEQALELGRLFNKGVYGGVLRANRFSPAFVGATMERVVEPLEEFNQWTYRLWLQTSEDRALEALDEILRNPTRFPGAGSSYTTMLMYLRNPEKYLVWLRITHDGLAALTGFTEPSDRSGGLPRYLKFCTAAQKFASEYDLQPQELDAVFAAAARVASQKKTQPVARPSDEQSASITLAQVAKSTYLPIELLEEWTTLVTGVKRQALFYGPPGTGKTFLAEQLAAYIAGSDGTIERAQFHPSYSYEDFLEGLRPEVSSQGMTYKVRPGSFRIFCDRVRNRSGTHVFIIDEINRAEVGSVLGELMQLLEYRGKSITLPYSQDKFSIPPNVVLLATMNTADRSLALVDFALRRRFHAFQLLPNREVLAKWAAGKGGAGEVALKFFDVIREAVPSPDYAPGHSYWMTKELSADELFRVWKYELRPYLAEYWFEDPSRLEQLDTQVRELLAQEA